MLISSLNIAFSVNLCLVTVLWSSPGPVTKSAIQTIFTIQGIPFKVFAIQGKTFHDNWMRDEKGVDDGDYLQVMLYHIFHLVSFTCLERSKNI